MNSFFLFLTVFLTSLSCAFGQNCGQTSCSNEGQCKEITLTTPLQPATNCSEQKYSARDVVHLGPGFQSGVMQSGKPFHAWVDKNFVLPVDYTSSFTQTDFNNRQINTNLPVGRIEGVADVSPSGAATYTIPIYTPSGTAGMQPSIALSYNSQSGNGLLGYGWNISGLSSISRVQKNKYHDDACSGCVDPGPYAIQVTSPDAFALDGNRLIPYQGGIYYTEIEGFSKIARYGTITSPEWFNVETKDGLTIEYGKTDDSKFTAPNSPDDVIVWNINKIYDNYGNYLSYKYIKVGNEVVIKEIRYTGNTNLSTYNVIRFRYDTRQDENFGYIAGSKFLQTLLLRQIEIISETSILKKYNFSYSYNNEYSFLSEITEKGANDIALNSTMFKYPVGSLLSNAFYINPFTPTGIPSQSAEYLTGDFNGDGKSDVVAFTYTISNGARIYHNRILYLNQNGTNFQEASSELLPLGFFPFDPQFPGAHLADNTFISMGLRTLDLNGDGLDDLLLGNLANGQYTYVPYFSTGSNFTQGNSIGVGINFNHRIILGDFNADKITDVFIFYQTTNGWLWNIYAFTPSGVSSRVYDKVTLNGTEQLTSAIVNSFFMPIDFDGDGKTEILTYTTGFGEALVLRVQDKISFSKLVEIYRGTFPADVSTGYSIYPGDFNGDGITDLLETSGANWWIGYGKGKNGFSIVAQADIPGLNLTNYAQQQISIDDYNGDGKSDILETIKDYTGISSSPFKYHFSYGPKFISKSHALSTTDWGVAANIFGDFNGDGSTDVLVKKSNNAFFVSDVNLYGNTKYLLSDVLDGFNRKTSFEYNRLTSGGSFYTKYSGETYPANDFQGHVHAVSKITVPDGIGGTTDVTYSYEGAKFHRTGKGFLGFSKMNAVNNVTGITSVSEYEIIPTFYFPALKKNNTFITSSNQLLKETIFTNDIKDFSQQFILGGTNYGYIKKRFFPFASQTVSTNNLKGQTITSNFTYNDDGNLTNSSVNIGTAETESATYTYVQKGSWIPNRIETQSITKTRAGDDYTISNSYDYDSNGKLTEQKVFNGLAKEITTQYAYNSIGNLISATVSSPGLTSRTTTINEYDDMGRFPTKTTNPLGQVAEAQYDQKWGTPLMQKGVDGLITTYQYDAFGKLIKTKTPDNIETNYTLDWAIGTTVPGISGVPLNGLVYSSSVQRSGSLSATTWYDIYSRAIKTQADGFAEPINAVKLYNAKGQLETVTAPFYDGDVPEIKTYAYETSGVKTGLLESVSSSLDGIITYDYTNSSSGLFKTEVTNPAGQTSSQTADASGKVISADDDNGTILNYTYYGHGQLKEVTMSGQNQPLASMQYDEYARQNKLTDKNAGVINYTYNAYGELVHQDDYNGAYNFEYDILGRMTARRKVSNPSPPETSWEYWDNGAGINQVKSIADVGAGISQNFTYDALGRPTESREVIGGDNYTTSYQYDEFSNISKITYPSGFFIEKEYNQTNGYLKKVKNPSLANPIFEAVKMNAFGQYMQYNQNNILTEKTYNAFGMLEHSMAGNFFHLQNDWNVNTGNLETRTDYVSDITETFAYDNLNRLTSSAAFVGGIPQNQINISYYPNGNIQNKTRIGNYSYEADKLNAVEQVGNTAGDISNFIQDITYTTFNKCSTITENNKVLTLTYGPDQQRRKSILTDNGAETKNIIYSGNYEKITIRDPNALLPDKIYEVHYISCGAGLVSIAVKEDGGTAQFFNVYTDHLGSIVKITNSQNTVIYEQNFDAWGRERNPTDWSYSDNTNSKPEWLLRGFTGHEHLPEFALINMNGRVYDPLLGRMNSPDNLVQSPFSTQSYNRYTYADNNPLRYVDPSGNDLWDVIFSPFRLFNEGVNVANERANANSEYKYDWNYVGTGQLPNDWRNNPNVVLGPNGYPMGPSGEYSAFGELPGEENTGSTGFVDASGQQYQFKPVWGTAWVGASLGNKSIQRFDSYYIKGYDWVPVENKSANSAYNAILYNPQFINLPEGDNLFIDWASPDRTPGLPIGRINFTSGINVQPVNGSFATMNNYGNGTSRINEYVLVINPTAVWDVKNAGVSSQAFENWEKGNFSKSDYWDYIYFRVPEYGAYPNLEQGSWRYGYMKIR